MDLKGGRTSGTTCRTRDASRAFMHVGINVVAIADVRMRVGGGGRNAGKGGCGGQHHEDAGGEHGWTRGRVVSCRDSSRDEESCGV